MSTWKRFEAGLAAGLAVLTEGQFLIVGTRAGTRFVQFNARGEQGLRAEAASNRVLSATERLDLRGVEEMDALGWNRPTHDLIDDVYAVSGSCNHWFDYEAPVAFTTVAEQAVQTLVDVFRVRHVNELVYSAFTEAGRMILLPTLGLALDRSKCAGDSDGEAGLAIEELKARVFRTLFTEFDDVEPGDGEVLATVRWGAGRVFVFVIDDPPVVRVWSPLVSDVPEDRLETLIDLNERNGAASFVRFLVASNTVIATYDMFGWPFEAAHLRHAVRMIGDLADSVDDAFCAHLGGRQFFDDDAAA